MREFSYAYLGFQQDGSEPAPGRWSEGQSMDGKGEFTTKVMKPLGGIPSLVRRSRITAAPRPNRFEALDPMLQTSAPDARLAAGHSDLTTPSADGRGW